MRGEAVLEALGGSSLGALVLDRAAERDGVHAVGGYVRDVLLGRPPREIDLVVEGDAGEFARDLAARMGGAALEHGRFGTATVQAGGGDGPGGGVGAGGGIAGVGASGERVDLASARTEVYPEPGSLPDVRLGAELEEDLRRRDFTVNAIAVALSGPERGRLAAVPQAEDDLAAGRLRVLHEGSFRDDPTRLLRMVRYAERLGFDVEPDTGRLARDALAAGVLGTVSAARLGAELRLALTEPDPVAGLARMEDLGVLAALDGRLGVDEGLARRALSLLPPGADPGVVAVAVAARGFGDRTALSAWLDELEFPARERDRIVAAALRSEELAAALAGAGRPSGIHAAAAGRPVEEVAVAGALGPEDAARRWLDELRHVRLEITGDDLLAAGVPAGPEIGRRLSVALARRLDGELAPGAEAELDAALAA